MIFISQGNMTLIAFIRFRFLLKQHVLILPHTFIFAQEWGCVRNPQKWRVFYLFAIQAILKISHLNRGKIISYLLWKGIQAFLWLVFSGQNQHFFSSRLEFMIKFDPLLRIILIPSDNEYSGEVYLKAAWSYSGM